jgi:hypothetical protein
MMWTPITALSTTYAANARNYRIMVEGLERDDGTWTGRLVFRDGVDVRVTEPETSQPNRQALEYWATGLEYVYLDGAFRRARMSDEP